MKVFKKIGISLLSLVLIGCGSSNKESTVSQSISSTESKQSTELESKETSETKPKKKVVSNLTLDQISKERSLEESKSLASKEEEKTKRDNELFQAIVYGMLKDYVSLSGYDPKSDGWTVRAFRDQPSDGPKDYIVTTKARLEGVAIKQPVMAVFTFYPDSETYTGHFLSIGDKVFKNDDYIDELYEKYLGDDQ